MNDDDDGDDDDDDDDDSTAATFTHCYTNSSLIFFSCVFG